MFRKYIAALAALTIVSTPAAAFETLGQQQSPGVMFYFSVPLDAPKKQFEKNFAAGLQIQGKRSYESVTLDSRMFNNFFGTGLEAKWIIAGVVAAGAIVAVASKDKSTSNQQQQQQQQQAAAQQQAAQGGGGGTTQTFHPDGTPHVEGDNCACHG
jgi:hypothetical protein